MIIGLALLCILIPNQSKGEVISEKELNCITTALYHESRGESEKGKLAVVNVILNRKSDDYFKQSSACGVVYAKGQFSWTKHTKTAPKNDEFFELYDLTKKAIEMRKQDKLPCKNATFFTSNSFSPKHYKLECVIGNHKFYTLRKKVVI